MGSNLSKIRRDKMLNAILKIKEKIEDEDTLKNLSLIEHELTKKKYGLLWEEHEEKIDEELKTKIPTFEEAKEKEIVLNKDKKFNFLLEGDNLHSLYLLEKTHKGKIDLIYIDPPYNTGNKDFVYDDDIVGFEDGFKHSKWISFMERRLRIAHKLLKKEGIIFISIDDNEQAQLKMLCDEIFEDTNCVGILPTIMNLKGNQDQLGFAGTHEYTLVYAKNIYNCNFGQFSVDEEEIEKEWLIDEIGYYKKGATLKATGIDADRTKRPYMFYPVLIKNDLIEMIEKEEYKKLYNADTKTFNDVFLEEIKKKYKKKGFYVLLPLQPNGEYGRWRWGFDNMCASKLEVIVNMTNGFSLYKKQRPNIGDIPTKKPKSFFYKPEYSSGNGTNQVVNIFGSKIFTNPKPVELVKDFIRVGLNSNNGMILDFFAGSGTTAQAVLELNKEDNGNRQFILCTNNENNICEEITYQRIKTVITGKRKDNTEYSEGIDANLKYYKTTYIPRLNTEEENIQENIVWNIENLIQLENGIRVDGKRIKVILEEEKLDRFSSNVEEVKKCKKLYISSDILLTTKQVKAFKENHVEVYIIPEYYFNSEIKEVQ